MYGFTNDIPVFFFFFLLLLLFEEKQKMKERGWCFLTRCVDSTA